MPMYKINFEYIDMNMTERSGTFVTKNIKPIENLSDAVDVVHSVADQVYEVTSVKWNEISPDMYELKMFNDVNDANSEVFKLIEKDGKNLIKYGALSVVMSEVEGGYGNPLYTVTMAQNEIMPVVDVIETVGALFTASNIILGKHQELLLRENAINKLDVDVIDVMNDVKNIINKVNNLVYSNTKPVLSINGKIINNLDVQSNEDPFSDDEVVSIVQ